MRSGDDASRKLLEDRGVSGSLRKFDQFWKDFHTFILLSHATGKTEEAILAPAEALLHYDFPNWLASDDITDPAPHCLAEPTLSAFKLTEEGAEELAKALAVWTTHTRGLSKLVTRIRVESQVRQSRPVNAPKSELTKAQAA